MLLRLSHNISEVWDLSQASPMALGCAGIPNSATSTGGRGRYQVSCIELFSFLYPFPYTYLRSLELKEGWGRGGVRALCTVRSSAA